MGPGVKYTLARLGLLAACFLVLLPFNIDLLLKLLIAVAVSAILSWFLLRKLRDEYALSLQKGFDQRRVEKEKLRSTLAGDKPKASDQDEPDSDRDSDGPSKSNTAP